MENKRKLVFGFECEVRDVSIKVADSWDWKAGVGYYYGDSPHSQLRVSSFWTL